MKIIVVGAGQWAEEVCLKELKNSNLWEIAALVDLNKDRLSRGGEKYQIDKSKRYTDLDVALNRVKADAVYVLVPPSMHAIIIEKVIKKGFHVLTEKPLAHNLESAKKIVELARNSNLKTMVNQNYRWRKPILQMKEVIRKGLIGEPCYINYNFYLDSTNIHSQAWRINMKDLLLQDMAIHHLDLVRFITGKNGKEVFARSKKLPWSWTKGRMLSSILLEMENDIHVNYFGSFVARGKQTTWNGNIQIVGEKGTVMLEDDMCSLYTTDGKLMEIENLEFPYWDVEFSYYEFKCAIEQNRDAQTNFIDNYQSFIITWAALKSVETSSPVKLSEL